MNTGNSIPYHLRPHKAIERNLFIDLLKRLNSFSGIDISEYRYIGFGAAFLEDFRSFHLELGITKMDSIEKDMFAFSRQKFNKPYDFINPICCSSGDYLANELNNDHLNIVWFDYVSVQDLRNQLLEIQDLAQKSQPLDILKFTLNAHKSSFLASFQIANAQGVEESKNIISFLKEDETFKDYVPPQIEVAHLKQFDSVIRSMAMRAINRGLSSISSRNRFNLLSSFTYADGQTMTTITGIITQEEAQFNELCSQTKLDTWDFRRFGSEDFETSHTITVPAMTMAERILIDSKIHLENNFLSELPFKFGSKNSEHKELVEGYHKYYKYLPYFSKVTY